MSTARRRYLGLGLALLLSAEAAPLWAQDARSQAHSAAESQAAEALFRQAKSLMGQGQYAEACEKFSASQALEPGLGTLLFLGDCYEHAGRFASALATFNEAQQFAKRRAEDEREHLASVRAAALEPRVPKLELRVGSDPLPEGLQITLNGLPIERSELNQPLPRDAGSYEVRFSAPGYQTFTSKIELRNGETRNAVLNVPRLVSFAEAAAVGRDPQPGQSSHGSTQRTLAWVLGATGLAAGIGAGVLGILAAGKNSDSKEHCDADSPNRCDPTGVSARDDAKSLANLATIAGIVGAVGVAGGVVLYISAPSSSERGVPNAAQLTLSVPLL
jgi:serine/threonine-protein kinase